jgi:hypothetical protein
MSCECLSLAPTLALILSAWPHGIATDWFAAPALYFCKQRIWNACDVHSVVRHPLVLAEYPSLETLIAESQLRDGSGLDRILAFVAFSIWKCVWWFYVVLPTGHIAHRQCRTELASPLTTAVIACRTFGPV